MRLGHDRPWICGDGEAKGRVFHPSTLLKCKKMTKERHYVEIATWKQRATGRKERKYMAPDSR
jgi:hypothetical protein